MSTITHEKSRAHNLIVNIKFYKVPGSKRNLTSCCRIVFNNLFHKMSSYTNYGEAVIRSFTLGWHLVVVVELVCLNDPESCAGGDFWSLAGLTMPDWSKGRGQTKSSPWSSRLGVGRRADNPLPEKRNLSPKTKLELPLRPIGKQGYRMLTPTTFHPSNCCHCTKCMAFTFAQK